MPQNSTVVLTAGTIPGDYCFTTFQTLFTDFVAQLSGYVPGTYNFFNYGDTSPAPADRDKPWLRTVAGIPDRWYVYANLYGEWVWPHEVPQAGSERRIWVGTEADLKTYDGGEDTVVTGTTGPFWEADTAFAARTILAPGTLPSTLVVAVGDTGGSERDKVTLTEEEIPKHRHYFNTEQNGGSSYLPNQGSEEGQLRVGAGTAVSFIQTAGQEVGRTREYGGKVDGTTKEIDATNLPPYKAAYIIKRTQRQFRRAT